MSRTTPYVPPVDCLAAARAGENVQLSASVWAFRLPKRRFRWGQSYAYTNAHRTVLVDAVHAITRDAVEAVLANLPPVEALLLTHADLLDQAFGSVDDLSAWLDAPVVIHEADRRDTSAWLISGDPDAPHEGDLVVSDVEFTATHVPGHTPGSVVYAIGDEAVFCGDAAVGPSYDASRAGPGVSAWSHPPIAPADWPAFVAGWRRVPVQRSGGLFPLHGRPIVWWDGWDSPHLDISHAVRGARHVEALLNGRDALAPHDRLPASERGVGDEVFAVPLLDAANEMQA